MGEQGYVEGHNVWIDYHWAEGHYSDLDALATDLVRNKVTLIAATGGVVSAKAAKRATTAIPIVFVVGFDPVQLGLVASINKPGGNATGASVYTTELAAKRLSLLSVLVPGTGTIGILVNPGSATTERETKDTLAAAQRLGRPIAVFKATTESEIDAPFPRLLSNRSVRSSLAPIRFSPFDALNSWRSPHVTHCQQFILGANLSRLAA